MPALSLQSRLSRSADVAAKVVAEEAILIHLQTGTYYSLNAVGTVFWNALDGERTIAEHARAIGAEYAVGAEVVEADLLELGDELVRERLALVAAGEPPA
jgi:hypothetical protein